MPISNRSLNAKKSVNDYDANAFDWLRGRAVLAGEDAVKSAGEKVPPRLNLQTDEDLLAIQAGFLLRSHHQKKSKIRPFVQQRTHFVHLYG